MDGRGHRGRLRRSGSDPRRDHRPPVGHASPDGAPLCDGVLAEREALPAHLDAEPGTDPPSGRRPARPGHRRCGLDRRVLRRRIREQDHRSPIQLVPALFSRKLNRPVMLRIHRAEESYLGRARPGIQARVRIGFRADGRITALDLFALGDAGPYARGDQNSAANAASSRTRRSTCDTAAWACVRTHRPRRPSEARAVPRSSGCSSR